MPEGSLARWPRCSRLSKLLADGGQLPGLDGLEVECVYFGAYLRWDADDPVDRVFDDFIEYANCASDGYTDLFGAGRYLSMPRGSMSGSTRPVWGCSCCRHWIG
jgi:hypothetical protein